MQKFTLSKSQRTALLPYHREFQAAIAEVANQKMGIVTQAPEVPFKAEGGVIVNGKTMVIFDDRVMYDFLRDGKDYTATAPVEESAVVLAIHQIANDFEINGASVLKNYRTKASKLKGNRLTAMFNL